MEKQSTCRFPISLKQVVEEIIVFGVGKCSLFQSFERAVLSFNFKEPLSGLVSTLRIL